MGDMYSEDCGVCDWDRRKAESKGGDWLAALSARVIVCPHCGDVLCPKATWHGNTCAVT